MEKITIDFIKTDNNDKQAIYLWIVINLLYDNFNVAIHKLFRVTGNNVNAIFKQIHIPNLDNI